MAAATTTASRPLLLSRQQAAASSLQCRLPRRPGSSLFAGQGQASTPNVRCMAVVDTPSAPAVAPARKRSSYDMITLTTWLLKQEQEGVIDNEMTIVLSSISTACKQIASLVQRAPISNLTGVQGATNVQGEDQKKLDVISNEVFSNCLRWSGRTGVIASEEEDVPVAVEESYSGNYIVVFDPLDGSSNIDAAVSTGSIFGIYSPSDECHIGDDATVCNQDLNFPFSFSTAHSCANRNLLAWSVQLDEVTQMCIVNVCQPGSNLLAAGYCMYSSSVIFVLTIGTGVYVFTLDPMYGEFVLTQEKVQIPKSGKIYSFNEGNYALWDDKLKKYMDSLKEPGTSGKPYSARYIGSLVGDFHRTMLYGGIYGYPSDQKSKNGKLRLLYESIRECLCTSGAWRKWRRWRNSCLQSRTRTRDTHAVSSKKLL
uniref:fructose-bisphosphatase n=1 Tax=Aegilops tauschii TaxID=37682 RepID=M8BGH9_AEGTA